MNNEPDYEDNLYFKKLQKSKNVANNVTNENSQDLTERWKKGNLPNGEYYIIDELGLSDTSVYFEKYGFAGGPPNAVLAPVPSYEKWRALNENMDSVMQTNQAMGKKLLQLKELLKECSPYVSRSATSRMIKNSVGFKKDMKLLTKIDEVLK